MKKAQTLRTRRTFTVETKILICEEIGKNGQTPKSVAKKHSIDVKMLYRWNSDLSAGNFKPEHCISVKRKPTASVEDLLKKVTMSYEKQISQIKKGALKEAALVRKQAVEKAEAEYQKSISKINKF
jgi:transposase-like protein